MRKYILLLALASAINTGVAQAGWLEELAKATEKPSDKSRREMEERWNSVVGTSLLRKDIPMPDASSYSATAFDISSTSIDPLYNGHNLGILWNTINQTLSSKGKFESTTEFEKRKASISTIPLIGDMGINSTFVAKKTLLPGNVAYDADKKKMMVFVNSDAEICDTKKTFQYTIYTDFRSSQEFSTYTGENGFGANTEIKKFASGRVDLAGVNIKSKFDKAPKDRRSFQFEMSVDPTEAQRLEGNLSTLVFFKPKAPYLGGVNWHSSPTRQEPIDVSLDRFMIFCEIQAIWLYESVLE